MAQVLKKDGNTQDWDHAKLVRSLTNSGATPQEAENVASTVETWAQAASGPVSSADIRAQVMQALQNTNPTVATAYLGWKKGA